MSGSVCTGVVVLASVGALAVVPPTRVVPVKTDPSVLEQAPTAGGGYFAWAQSPAPGKSHFVVFSQLGNGPPFKVNAAGTEGRPGGISGKTLVYQQWRGRRSDIELLDLITRKRSKPPKGVNTRQSESRPSLSGNWLLFNRFNRRTKLQLVLLRNLRTGRQIELARARPPEHVLAAQIQGQYAVWTACRFRCGVLRYDIATHTRLAVPTSPIPEASDYAGAVTSDGTVYVTRRFSLSCKPGSDVLLLRFRPTDGQLTPLTRFQAGQVPTSLFATSEDGSPVVYFDRGPCGQPGDIYKVIEFAGPPPERQARNED